MIQTKLVTVACLLSTLMWANSCRTESYRLSSVQGGRYEITSAYDEAPDPAASAILVPYKEKVDSLMSPVIGISAMGMEADRPESLLSNLVADVLREATEKYTGTKADIGLVNMGGLRSSLPEGEVTYGNIFQILPFENTLCIVSMNGAQLRQLFENIAAVEGEGLSGARLVISNKKLEKAEVGGRPIEDERIYRVSTIDYLAEGNDGMTALKLSHDRVLPEGATLRQLLLDYVADLHKQGKKVTSNIDGRITVK